MIPPLRERARLRGSDGERGERRGGAEAEGGAWLRLNG